MDGACCFPKAARLRRRWEFLEIQRRGRRNHSGTFVVLRMEKTASGVARLGVTVSSRVGGAVVRNRIKRQVREAFRACRQSLPAGDLVLIATAGTARLPLAQIRRQAGEALSHA